MNLYTFADGSPINIIDVFGLSAWDAACKVPEGGGGSLNLPLAQVTVTAELKATTGKGGLKDVTLKIKVSKSLWDFVPGGAAKTLRKYVNAEVGVVGSGTISCCKDKAQSGSVSVGVFGGASVGSGGGTGAQDKNWREPGYYLPNEKPKPTKGLFVSVSIEGTVTWNIPGDFMPDDGGIYWEGKAGYRFNSSNTVTFLNQPRTKLWP